MNGTHDRVTQRVCDPRLGHLLRVPDFSLRCANQGNIDRHVHITDLEKLKRNRANSHTFTSYVLRLTSVRVSNDLYVCDTTQYNILVSRYRYCAIACVLTQHECLWYLTTVSVSARPCNSVIVGTLVFQHIFSRECLS